MSQSLTLILRLVLCSLICCSVIEAQEGAPTRDRINPDVAGNAEVERILKTFPGRGQIGDDTPPTVPEIAVKLFELPDDLQIELVAAEPAVEQPLFLHFDHRGRMWVVQYRQYPFPAGLKIIHYDQHLRAVFDKVPEPPPQGVPGADKLTVFEDTNGDGRYDSHRDVITGLNIATSVLVANGGIWVLNPPYLLFYPDADDDAVPDGDPVVHLSGFGLEDTHSVANSLSWGPDGWIYGANGSTTKGTVSSRSTQNIRFEGQCIWRYHPDSGVFEIYGEGGGNTFSSEIDRVGRVFSGTNYGGTRGMHYPQGSYGVKGWGKHGPLTNPYAFGYFEHMPHVGDGDRFPQTFVIYEGGTLPERYHGTVIAANALHNRVWASKLTPVGSTFRTEDLPTVVTTPDRWFRPVDVKVGPDGAVYLADWYDTRLSHVDPRDNWHKTSGRIYRLSAREPAGATAGQNGLPDFSQLTEQALLQEFSAANKWRRQTAVRVLAERLPRLDPQQQDETVQQLVGLLREPAPEAPVLEALWTLHLTGQLKEDLLSQLLHHSQPDARRWALRLLGDRRFANEAQLSAINLLAAQEQHAEVLSQLASTLKRLPAALAVPILPTLLRRGDLLDDPHLPLLAWWAVEAHCGVSPDELSPHVGVRVPQDVDRSLPPRVRVLQLLEDPQLWSQPLVERWIVRRLMQRFALESVLEQEQSATANEIDTSSLQACVRLFELAPSAAHSELLMGGFLEAYEGRSIQELPATLAEKIQAYRESLGSSNLALGIKLGDQAAIQQALQIVKDERAPASQRLSYLELLGQSRQASVVPTLLGLLGSASPGVKRLSLQALMNFDDPQIGQQICSRWQTTITEEHNLRGVALQVLASRAVWSRLLLQEIAEFRIKPTEIPLDIVQQMRLHPDEELQKQLDIYWGKTRATSEEKQLQINRLRGLLTQRGSEPADPAAGRELFVKHCGTCHTLFNAGGQTGPNLTGYERTNLDFMLTAIVDPSAAIREEFTQYQVALEDGRILTGLIVEQSPTVVVIRGANNQLTTLNRAEIEVLQALPTSLMPDGLMEKLTDEEVQQLFAYLTRRTPLPENTARAD
jgi:putative heme-binding domain-containing protein